MKEFMLLIRNSVDNESSLPPGQFRQFLDKCEVYMNQLTKEKKLLSAQPLTRGGRIITGSKGAWEERPFDKEGAVMVGYYHIMARDIDAAVDIAKQNPEFEYGKTAEIEVRQVKTKEEATEYTYPVKEKPVK